MSCSTCARPLVATVSIWAALLLCSGMAFAQEDETGWSGEINVNLSNQTGTTDTFNGNLKAQLSRSWEKDVLGVKADGIYGFTRDRRDTPSQEETTQNAQTVKLEWQRTVSGRLFWQTDTRASRDTIQDINFEYRFASGPAYRIWQGERPKKELLDLSTRVGYRFVTFRDSTGEDTQNLIDLIAGYEYKNLVFEDRLEIVHSSQVLLPANQIDSWIGQTGITFGVPITASWSMRVGFEAEYRSRTPEDVTNLTTQTTGGLAYKF